MRGPMTSSAWANDVLIYNSVVLGQMTNPIPLPRASLSSLVKQPGELGYKLHSKCSKCK